MADRAGNQFAFSRVASGNLPVNKLATLNTAPDVTLATSGVLAFPIVHRADDNQNVGLVSGGHCKLTFAGSIGAGVGFAAGNSGYATLASTGAVQLGYTLTACDTGLLAECLFVPSTRPTS